MESRTLGDYRLLEKLEERDGEVFWLAEQASVGRKVRLVELTDPSRREDFLGHIRAKASVDHPLIGSVYEAVDDGECFAALEFVSGSTLADRLRAREAMRPADLAHVFRRTAEAMLQLEANDCATRPLTPGDIHFDAHGVVRLDNTVRSGKFNPAVVEADIVRLGRELPPLVADGLPGASRVLTVLAWMRGEGVEKPLTWSSIRSYGEQIEEQLRETRPLPTAPRTQPAKRKSKVPAVLAMVTGLIVIAAAITILLPKNEAEVPVTEPTLPDPVFIPAGVHPTPDGDEESLGAFEIGACEVTIGEYLQFLQVLERLEPGERDVFDVEGQPAEKKGHEPDDWQAMLDAARDGAMWRGRQMDLFCPVVNVDWWDASAFCNWKGARLPTQEQWFAALRAKATNPGALQPSAWGPVTEIGNQDRTPNGLRGMAGSVAEWTRRPAVNPANPLGPRHHVIIGGSYDRPANGALAREWTPNRLQRRPDLGFRVVLRPE
ncbi:SUMF1/EgtB/PvdO family nonheme iron enzyme [Haloferula sp. A504]|uniref:SUMF1/EgtB/PvdO family nonheme iron enzyme n=1 Tax=Haloferula sp. A504 TaxID=3373601 RepID=UPI0031CBEBC1|nr:SUMF1/EgtB/PvdO family nonheme iron enzyme [Verrucomicrobiaceae bacterium E54]